MSRPRCLENVVAYVWYFDYTVRDIGKAFFNRKDTYLVTCESRDHTSKIGCLM